MSRWIGAFSFVCFLLLLLLEVSTAIVLKIQFFYFPFFSHVCLSEPCIHAAGHCTPTSLLKLPLIANGEGHEQGLISSIFPRACRIVQANITMPP